MSPEADHLSSEADPPDSRESPLLLVLEKQSVEPSSGNLGHWLCAADCWQQGQTKTPGENRFPAEFEVTVFQIL